MKKKNVLTRAEAEKIWHRLEKNAMPSESLKEYVHNVLLKKHHYLFQYKVGKQRFGYCTYCKNDFNLEIKAMRTFDENDIAVLEAKHNEEVVCPCCGNVVTKRYAGYSRKDTHADVAEFAIDESGALVVYVYYFSYDYSANFHIKEPRWSCYQIGYFDIHKYFHLLHGWGGDFVYLEDNYTSNLFFTNCQNVDNPQDYFQNKHEGIKCFNLESALKKSNLKYSCLMECMGETKIVDMFKFLKMYCSYPEITEKLIKEGHQYVLESYLDGGMKGLFNFRATTVKDFFKLDKAHYNLLKNIDRLNYSKIKAMQVMSKNNVKFTPDNFSYLKKYAHKADLISLLLQFVGIKKLQTYVKKQGEICRCQNNYNSSEDIFFENFKDYIIQCKMLGYNLADKNVVMPANLFQSHHQLTELINRQKAEEKAKANAARLKKFLKRLPKLQEKYSYSDGIFLIRPAEGYEDLCKEGTALHHCVYSNYSDSYMDGKTDILFIRKASDPDTPFYTVEFCKNHLVQCRTLHNAGATDAVNAFLKKWQAYLKSNNNKQKEVA